MATGRVPTTANSPLTAKGDLFGYSTTQARVAVGNDGETLVADSSTSTGLRYQGNFAAGKNAIINGDFNIWQRGTSFTNPAGTFTADRFSWDTVAMTGTVTRQAFTAGTAPVAGYEGTFFARLDITSGSQFGEFVQKIENGRTNAGQTVTASFWARLNSGASGWQVNVVQNFGTGGSPSSAVLAGQTSFTPTSSWQRFTFTVAVPSVAGKTFGTNNNSFLAMTIQKTSTTASQLDTWGWQLEVGNTATAFQTATGTIQGELAACQRYYFRTGQGASTAYEPFSTFSGAYNTTTVDPIVVPAPVTMRVNPTSLEYANVLMSDGVTGYSTGTWSLSSFGSDQMLAVKYQHGSALLTAFRPYVVTSNNSTSGYLAFNAEL